MSKLYIGIDPGQSGGIAAIFNGTSFAYKMPETEVDFIILMRRIVTPNIDKKDVIVLLEKVHSMPGQGVASTFKFGKGYGLLRGVILTMGLRLEDVTPQAWQKGLAIPKRDKSRDESKTHFKNRLKAMAQQLFPHIKFTLATADAMLIAEFCRRTNK